MLVSLCNNERLWRRSNALKYSAPGQSMTPSELIAMPCDADPDLDIVQRTRGSVSFRPNVCVDSMGGRFKLPQPRIDFVGEMPD
jgi:hypothetical protein